MPKPRIPTTIFPQVWTLIEISERWLRSILRRQRQVRFAQAFLAAVLVWIGGVGVLLAIGGGQESLVTLEVGFSRPVSDDTLTKSILAVPDIGKVERRDEMNLILTYGGTVAAQEQILKRLASMDVGLISYRPATTALEDVYLNLVADSR
ncbi:MAG: hypothetical protein OK455_04320 [Thaumarchaeota archaeon]|nr:hypothetical protein [Nitrososphaerota archaeon]